jgi:hypothetical protein
MTPDEIADLIQRSSYTRRRWGREPGATTRAAMRVIHEGMTPKEAAFAEGMPTNSTSGIRSKVSVLRKRGR